MKSNELERKLPYNLQFFAEPSGDAGQEDVANEPETNNANDVGANTPDPVAALLETTSVEAILARPEFAKAVQSATDKRVTQALATAKDKWQAEYEENQDEAKRLEKMTADQREKYQFEKDKKAFDDQKKAFEHEQLKVATGNELLKRGLNPSFADYLTGKTAEETKVRIDEFEKLYNSSLSLAVNDKLKGKTPQDTNANKGITMETIKQMSPEEINKHWNEVQEVLKK